ncbi:MAG: RHS repeat-associated core domain-containing protein [Fimbriimonadaceae bacterium]|nr:RHS repeat-associated core domain-containing protein [Fimbriimonadaceae bacterium]QOJ12968.1 MAG: RHS repeat-associated core domain-containing protein [Chthonomonadaceae bacterium]
MRTDKVEGFNLSWEWTLKTHTSGYYDEIQGQNLPTSRYYYDGQMMVEDDYTVEGQYEPVVTVMRYGIGARGIDFMDKRVDDGPETKGYPIYDGHGNMIATLGRSESSPYFGVADLRSYDVWGSVRSGSTTGDPKQRYCANLGHVQDDESGLIYMRARYYEPWSGRFISEDPAHSGGNWNIYCDSDPVNYRDSTGKAKKPDIEAIEELVRRLFREGLITKEYFERFLNRQSDIRRVLHNQYSKMGFTLEEIAELIIDDCQMRGHKFLSGIGIGLTTLDAAFNQDPIFVMELLREIFTSGRE